MMTERDFHRLRALVGPLLPHLRPAERAEATRLLKGPPAHDLFPSTPGAHLAAVPREEWPHVAVRCGEPAHHNCNPERF